MKIERNTKMMNGEQKMIAIITGIIIFGVLCSVGFLVLGYYYDSQVTIKAFEKGYVQQRGVWVKEK